MAIADPSQPNPSLFSTSTLTSLPRSAQDLSGHGSPGPITWLLLVYIDQRLQCLELCPRVPAASPGIYHTSACLPRISSVLYRPSLSKGTASPLPRAAPPCFPPISVLVLMPKSVSPVQKRFWIPSLPILGPGVQGDICEGTKGHCLGFIPTPHTRHWLLQSSNQTIY